MLDKDGNPIEGDGDGQKKAESDPPKSGNEPTGTGPGEGSGEPTGTLTQEKVNSLVGEARTSAKTKAQADLLKSLGVDDLDQAQALVKAARDQNAANMTELEKAQTENADLLPYKEKATVLEAKVTEYEATLTTHLTSLKETLNVPDHVEKLTTAMPVQEQLAYFTENRDSFAKTGPPNMNGAAKGGRKSLTPEEVKKRDQRFTEKYGI